MRGVEFPDINNSSLISINVTILFTKYQICFLGFLNLIDNKMKGTKNASNAK